MQEISLESSNNILHSVNTHCWTIQNITEDRKERKKEVCHLSQLDTDNLSDCCFSSLHE